MGRENFALFAYGGSSFAQGFDLFAGKELVVPTKFSLI
jgi:hypothetical protein